MKQYTRIDHRARFNFYGQSKEIVRQLLVHNHFYNPVNGLYTIK